MAVEIRLGDCLAELQEIPDKSVNCCVTSPPYFNLRDYGIEGQVGLEKTPDEYIAKLVEVFREVRRVLTDDGTCWVNLGDSYCNIGHNKGSGIRGLGKNGYKNADSQNYEKSGTGLKHKDLIGVPWMVAFALRADGWYLRQDIVWQKPNVMPESVRDRCTKSHEYLFLLTKFPKYYFDADAIKEPAVSDHPSGNGFKRSARLSYQNADGTPRGNDEQWTGIGGLRNRRSVWTIPTKPFKDAHFATFPEALVEPMILAGCPVGGTVLDPFGGAGTTGLVARKYGRNAILLELNPEYVEIARRRLGPDVDADDEEDFDLAGFFDRPAVPTGAFDVEAFFS